MWELSFKNTLLTINSNRRTFSYQQVTYDTEIGKTLYEDIIKLAETVLKYSCYLHLRVVKMEACLINYDWYHSTPLIGLTTGCSILYRLYRVMQFFSTRENHRNKSNGIFSRRKITFMQFRTSQTVQKWVPISYVCWQIAEKSCSEYSR